MRRVAFTTLGCKVNQYETQRIQQDFERAGFVVVPFQEEADVYVINTCSVTGQAESKSRQTIRRARRANPNAKVIVTGCAAQMALNQGKEIAEADLVIPNPVKLETFRRFLERFPLPPTVDAAPHDLIRLVGRRTRATVKIQDGCDVLCSYCSIPKTRPVMTSRPYEEVLEEVGRLAEEGYREIVLTGVLIGAYGPKTGSGGPDFEDLIGLLGEVKGISRIRISSIEMRQVTDRLLELMANPASKVVPHLHIPLQSGSTKVLRDMNRPYTKEDYLHLCDRVYDRVPRVAITTDILVGFPTESDEDFYDTVDVCERVRYLKAHLFRFSLRPGTKADVWGDPVPPQVKQERSRILSQVTDRTRWAFVERFIGARVTVLVERRSPKSGRLMGHSEQYIEVELEGPDAWIGEEIAVRICETHGDVAIGEPLIPLTSTETPAGR
jgi:threonylcarbamoyladenosine tRNA methylthiotransferase MtaB